MVRRIRVVLIDDDPNEREDIRARLQGPGISVTAVHPPASIEEPLQGGVADVIVVDYQLSGREQGRQTANYRGSTLAAVLRERLPNHPIVLMTRDSLSGTARFAAARDVEGAFDEKIVKSKIYDEADGVRHSLVALVRGFQTLSTCEKTAKALSTVLGVRAQEEGDALLAADPPTAVLRNEPWRVPEVARWIRHTLLRYPGVLYDSLHAASTLGITVDAFMRPSVQRFFRSALYKGPFATAEFFWKNRLLDSSRTLLRKVDLADAPLSRFAEAWRKSRHAGLPMAQGVSSGDTPVDSVCFLLQQPVARQFSLLYRPDTRPAVMDPARVSFKAIAEHEDYEERFVSPDARALARAISRGEEAP